MARNKAKFMAALAAFAALAALAGIAPGSASAESYGGTSIIEHYFTPSTIQPGQNTTLTLTVQQDGESLSSDATVVTYNIAGAGLTYVSNGDTSADCFYVAYFDALVCEYSDFAHTYKSDSYNFTSNGKQPYGAYPVYTEVYTGEDQGYDSATTYIRYAPKPAVVTNSGMKLCYSINGQTPNDSGMYVTNDAATGAALMAAGYWAPTAVGFNADGTPILSCQTPLAGGLLNDPAASWYTDNNGDRLVPGDTNIVPGDYPVVLAS